MFSAFAINIIHILIVLMKTTSAHSSKNNTESKKVFSNIPVWLVGVTSLLGVFGLLLVIYLIWRYFRRRNRREDEGGQQDVDNREKNVEEPKANIYISKIHMNDDPYSSFFEENLSTIVCCSCKVNDSSSVQGEIKISVVGSIIENSVLEEDEAFFTDSFQNVKFDETEVGEASSTDNKEKIKTDKEKQEKVLKIEKEPCSSEDEYSYDDSSDLIFQNEQEIDFDKKDAEYEYIKKMILEVNAELNYLDEMAKLALATEEKNSVEETLPENFPIENTNEDTVIVLGDGQHESKTSMLFLKVDEPTHIQDSVIGERIKEKGVESQEKAPPQAPSGEITVIISEESNTTFSRSLSGDQKENEDLSAEENLKSLEYLATF